MDSFMSRFFKSSLISSILLLILGGLLIFESEITILSISYIIGGILVSLGVVAIIRFLLDSINSKLDIIYGIVTIILGSLIISNPKALASLIPIVLGICIVISSSTKLQYALELKSENNKLWIMTLIVAVISTMCGIILIFNPFKGAQMITQLVGIFIIIYALLDMISTFTIKKNINSIKKTVENNIKEADVIEEKTNKKIGVGDD